MFLAIYSGIIDGVFQSMRGNTMGNHYKCTFVHFCKVMHQLICELLRAVMVFKLVIKLVLLLVCNIYFLDYINLRLFSCRLGVVVHGKCFLIRNW